MLLQRLHVIFKNNIVPRTGFEPAHPCGRCDLNTVRLPISPSGHQNKKCSGTANIKRYRVFGK